MEDPFMFNKDSTCTSYHIYPNSMDFTLVLILEAFKGCIALRVASSSRFHILDSSANNYFLAVLLIVIFLINFALAVESSIEYLELSNKCSQTKSNFCRS